MIADIAISCHSKEVSNRVWSVSWNHKGTVLASCGDDKCIKLWKLIPEYPYLKYASTISGSHNRTIRHVSFSPDDKYLASTGFDSMVVIHQLYNNDYEEISRLEGHENEVKCCSFSPSGEYLATCGRDKTVWFWQLDEDEDFEVSSILQPHTQDIKFVTWHPVEELLVSCSYDCSIRFYRFDGEEWVTEYKIGNAHESTVWCASFSADGKSLSTVGADHALNIWRQETPSEVAKKIIWTKIANLLFETKWPLYTVAWNKLHGMIAVGGGDQKLRLLYLKSIDGGEYLEESCESRVLSSEINCLQWNPVENYLLAAANDIGEIQILKIVL